MPTTTGPPISIPAHLAALGLVDFFLDGRAGSLIGLARTKYFPCIVSSTWKSRYRHYYPDLAPYSARRSTFSSVDFHREGVQPPYCRAHRRLRRTSVVIARFGLLPRTAACSAVEPKTLRASITAPRLSSIQANAVCPWNTAWNSGVQSSSFRALTSARRSSRHCPASSFPLHEAACSGVSPYLFRLRTYAPRLY